MRGIFSILAIATVVFAASFVFSLPHVSGQNLGGTTGSWRANVEEDEAGKIHINFERKTRNGFYNHGSDYKISDFEGLSASQINSDNAQVKFRLVREAGTLECEGIFRRGKGVGEWTLIPNQNFLSEYEKPRV